MREVLGNVCRMNMQYKYLQFFVLVKAVSRNLVVSGIGLVVDQSRRAPNLRKTVYTLLSEIARFHFYFVD